jgi:hypothetical protein
MALLVLSLAMLAPAPRVAEDRLDGEWVCSLGVVWAKVELGKDGVCRETLPDGKKFVGKWSYDEKTRALFLRLQRADFFLDFEPGWPPKVKAAECYARDSKGNRAPLGVKVSKPGFERPDR